jgi:signal peptidase I
VGSVAGWWRVETVLSGSMRPTIHPGDLEILRSESTASVRVGQIVAFHPPHESITVTHRVIALDRRASGVWVVTKGDANNTKDPWGTVRLTGDHVWTVIGVVPRAGTADVWLRQPQLHLGLLIAVGLLCAAIALEAIWRQ